MLTYGSRPEPYEVLCPHIASKDILSQLLAYADRRRFMTPQELRTCLLQVATQFEALKRAGGYAQCCSNTAVEVRRVFERLRSDPEFRQLLFTDDWVDIKEMLITAERNVIEVLIANSPAARNASSEPTRCASTTAVFQELELRWEHADSDHERRMILSLAADFVGNYRLAEVELTRFLDLAFATFEARAEFPGPFSVELAAAARRLASMCIQLTQLTPGRAQEHACDTIRHRCGWIAEILRASRSQKHLESIAEWRQCLEAIVPGADPMYSDAFAETDQQHEQWYAETPKTDRPPLVALRELRTLLVRDALPRGANVRVYPERFAWKLMDSPEVNSREVYVTDIDASTRQHVKLTWHGPPAAWKKGHEVSVWPKYPGIDKVDEVRSSVVRVCKGADIAPDEAGAVLRLDQGWVEGHETWRRWVDKLPREGIHS